MISIDCVACSSIALSSSVVKMTYWSLENSYPLTISSRATISPSFGQMYCCLSREPSASWSRLKETPAEASEAA